jgi:hypothetical protein
MSMIRGTYSTHAALDLRQSLARSAHGRRGQRPPVHCLLWWQPSLDEDAEREHLELTTAEVGALRDYAEAHQGELPRVLMALCNDNATLLTVAEHLSSEPEITAALAPAAGALSSDRLLQLNWRYFCIGKSEAACMKARLRPTLLSLESLQQACQRHPMPHPVVPMDAAVPSEQVAPAEPAPPAEEPALEEAMLEEGAGSEMAVEPSDGPPLGEPRFTNKASVQCLNRALKRMLTERKKRLKHKGRWCCHQQLDVPYFAVRPAEDADGCYLSLYLQHATSSMSSQCSLCDGMCGDATVSTADERLLFNGALLEEAHRIADGESA